MRQDTGRALASGQDIALIDDLDIASLRHATGATTGPRDIGRTTRTALARPARPLAALSFVAGLWLIHILFYPVTLVMPAIINFAFGALAVAFSVLEPVNRLVRAKEERAVETEQAMSGA